MCDVSVFRVKGIGCDLMLKWSVCFVVQLRVWSAKNMASQNHWNGRWVSRNCKPENFKTPGCSKRMINVSRMWRGKFYTWPFSRLQQMGSGKWKVTSVCEDTREGVLLQEQNNCVLWERPLPFIQGVERQLPWPAWGELVGQVHFTVIIFLPVSWKYIICFKNWDCRKGKGATLMENMHCGLKLKPSVFPRHVGK